LQIGHLVNGLILAGIAFAAHQISRTDRLDVAGFHNVEVRVCQDSLDNLDDARAANMIVNWASLTTPPAQAQHLVPGRAVDEVPCVVVIMKATEFRDVGRADLQAPDQIKEIEEGQRALVAVQSSN
jgi:hypothetical protein